MALGASRAGLLWLVVKQGVGMAAIGAATGLCGAWSTQKFMSGLLFGISPVDSRTFVAGTLFLLAVATIASAIPAARVMHIEPAGALRQD
jgi:ABC-type antimicrobial peptide transport system permease subunit